MRIESHARDDFSVGEIEACHPACAASLAPPFLGMGKEDDFGAHNHGRLCGANAGFPGTAAGRIDFSKHGLTLLDARSYNKAGPGGYPPGLGELEHKEIEMADSIDFGIKDRVTVVTGASRGFGRGLAKAMARSGAIVAAAARSLPELETLAKEIRGGGGICEGFVMDLRDMASISSAFERIVARFGRIDILVNNAGMGNPIPAVDISESDWDWMMDLNLKGTFFCCQAAGKVMLAQRKGRIVNISSQASVVAIPGEAVYCASKGGLNMLTKVLAVEWSGSGVTVNAVGPTFIRTPGTAVRLDNPEFLAGVMAKLPRGRVATIDDVAGAVIYLASDAADMVTGTLLLVDGGWTAL